jgi:hypothetical protein
MFECGWLVLLEEEMTDLFDADREMLAVRNSKKR